MIQKIQEIGLGKLALLFLAGVVLLVLSFREEKDTSSGVGGTKAVTGISQTEHTLSEDSDAYCEERLKHILMKMEGVGTVECMLSPNRDGLVVAASGAKDAEVVLQITHAAEVLFGIPAHKVLVYELNDGAIR